MDENNKKKRMEEIFINDTSLRKKVKLSADFLRPAYQYTSIEIYNLGREKYYSISGIN